MCKGVDSVTVFSEGIALALNEEGSDYRIMKFLLDDGTVIVPEEEEIYAGAYSFFSEKFLAVYNRKGQYGFVNKAGQKVIDFKYSNAHPFSEGLASMMKNDGFFKRISGKSDGYVVYVDKDGDELRIEKSVGKIVMGTSFYKKEALVRTQDGRYCFIDNGGLLLRERQEVDFNVDAKFRLSKETNQDVPRTFSRNDVTTAEQDGLWGYTNSDGKWIIPPQFIEASPFSRQGYAPVRLKNGQCGVLKLVDGTCSISQDFGSDKIDKKEGKESVSVSVVVPEAYRSKVLSMNVVSKDFSENVSLSVEKDSVARVQMAIPLEDRVYRIQSNGLVLAEQAFEPVTPDADLEFKVKKKTTRANEKDIQYVEITVTNPGRKAFKGDVSFKGKGFVCKDNWLEIEPGGIQRISGYFTNVTKRENRSIVIETRDGKVTQYVFVIPIIG